jgi:hypothetical protein
MSGVRLVEQDLINPWAEQRQSPDGPHPHISAMYSDCIALDRDTPHNLKTIECKKTTNIGIRYHKNYRVLFKKEKEI